MKENENLIREFLSLHLPHLLSGGDNLIFTSDEVSSIDLIEVAVEIEREFGVKFRLGDINDANFSSIAKIATLVEASRKT